MLNKYDFTSLYSNLEAQAALYKALAHGNLIICTGTLVGPYTTHTTYYLSNGQHFMIVSPSTPIVGNILTFP